jgi:hypothetical protein
MISARQDQDGVAAAELLGPPLAILSWRKDCFFFLIPVLGDPDP